jgi:ABC-type bacteriocin/lantibiotic exporter with double-glycine peptidase domain
VLDFKYNLSYIRLKKNRKLNLLQNLKYLFAIMIEKNAVDFNNLLAEIFKILKSDKKGFYLLVSFGLILVILEVVSIGVFVPILVFFFKSQDLVLDNELLKIVQFVNKDNFLIFCLLIIFIIYLFRFFILLGINVYKTKYLYKINLKLSSKFLLTIFQKNIKFRSEKNSAEYLNLVGSINSFSQGTLQHIINIYTDTLVLFSLIFVLFFFDYKSTIITFFSFGLFSFFFYIIYRNKMYLYGYERSNANEYKIKSINEIFAGYKEILLTNTKIYFLEKFNFHNKIFAQACIKEERIRILPRLFLEVLIILFLILSILVFYLYYKDINSIIFKISIFSLVVLKLLPIINRIITSFHNIKNMIFASKRVLDLIKEFKSEDEKSPTNQIEIFKFNTLSVRNLNFDYATNKPSSNYILQNINIDINSGDRVGIVGSSGSGKSTIADLICGLIKPCSGNIFLNDEILKQDSLLKWHNIIGYVPQRSVVLDSNLLENISFGIDVDNIDIEKVKEVSRMVYINEFIDLKNDLNKNMLGESGLKISGGQRQRIGIARVLYRNPSFIIFDEATNALDLNLEDKILNNIFTSYYSKTFVIISHRKETLKYCNKIISLNNYKVTLSQN